MTSITLRIAILGAVALGTAMAQGMGMGAGMGMGYGRGTSQVDVQTAVTWRVDRIGAALNLTATQKDQAKAIFTAAYSAIQSLEPAIDQARTDLHNAIKTGKDIDKASAALSVLTAKARTIQAGAISQVYNLLTATQREQFDQLHDTGLCVGMGTGSGAGMGLGRMGRFQR